MCVCTGCGFLSCNALTSRASWRTGAGQSSESYACPKQDCHCNSIKHVMNYQEPIQAQPKISEGADPVPDASGPGPAFVARSATGGTENATGWRYSNGTRKRDLRLDAIR